MRRTDALADRRPGRRRPPVAAVLVVVGLCGCRAPITAPATSAPGAAPAGRYQLITEPGDGPTPLYNLMASATSSVDVAMYEFVDTRAEAILAADAARHVAVRVVLDRNREGAANQHAFSYLAFHGVAIRWAPPGFAAYHEKAIVVDRDVAVVATLNLTSRYYPTTRDFAVVDRQAADVAAMEAVFDHDFTGTPIPTPAAGGDLVWSPGSQAQMVAFIAAARSSVAVENEEMSDPAVIAALVADAHRGVTVTITMTVMPQWAAAFTTLVAAGAHVHVDTGQTPLYIHAKAVVVDAGTPQAAAEVGSQNDTVASLQHNRELGLIVADPAVVASLAATLHGDFAAASAWKP